MSQKLQPKPRKEFRMPNASGQRFVPPPQQQMDDSLHSEFTESDRNSMTPTNKSLSKSILSEYQGKASSLKSKLTVVIGSTMSLLQEVNALKRTETDYVNQITRIEQNLKRYKDKIDTISDENARKIEKLR